MPLAVPAPPTRTAGTRLTGAIWQADVTDSVNFLTSPPLFVGTQAAVQSIPNFAWSVVTLDTTQTDPYVGHSNTVNSSRYTAKAAGWYTVCGVAALTANGTGGRAARIQVNGSPIAGGANGFSLPASGNAVAVATPTRDVFLNVGDYVETAVWQGSGAALSTYVSSDVCSSMWVRFSHA